MPAEKFSAREYWERRHSNLIDNHRNVGHISFSSEQNFEMIVHKAIVVAHVLGRYGAHRGSKILDAGCGAGVLTDLLHQAGFEMTGVDVSPTAIASARQKSKARFEVAPLSRIRARNAFDVAICLDVLFHVIEDEEWRRTLNCLVESVRPGGLLLLIESFTGYGQRTPPHVRWRQREDYARHFSATKVAPLGDMVFQYPYEERDKTLMAYRKEQDECRFADTSDIQSISDDQPS